MRESLEQGINVAVTMKHPENVDASFANLVEYDVVPDGVSSYSPS